MHSKLNSNDNKINYNFNEKKKFHSNYLKYEQKNNNKYKSSNQIIAVYS